MADAKNVIICRCADLTEQDVVDAIDMGFDNLELLRRHLHLGMGPCQGRVCIAMVQRILARKTGKSIAQIGYPTPRAPISVMPVRVLAFKEGAEE